MSDPAGGRAINMRFVPDGPVIPNDRLQKWRDGKVIFLAGAGVSRPAGLPLFQGLALGMYKHLGDPVYSALNDGDDTDRLERARSRTDLSSRQKIEVELFLENQLDRLFAAAEARLDQDEYGRVTGTIVRDAVGEILGTATACAQAHRDLLRLSVPPSVIDPRGQPQCRIVTTNFDLLFEHAASPSGGNGHPGLVLVKGNWQRISM